MKIACIGTGFVGVVTTAVFAKLGHTVVGLDIDQSRINSLRQGKVPFFEPNLSELLLQTQQTGHLAFTTDYQEAITDADLVMIMVGTPSDINGQADLKYVLASAKSLAPHLKDQAVVVIKSTVPPGTNQRVYQEIKAHTQVEFDLASVPEFLREGTAVDDTLHPDRIIIGATKPSTIKLLTELHQPLTDNILVMSPESAQMAKYSANTYLATRITFANQIANLCEHNGADVEEVLRGIGADSRIGNHYWYPGLGYGGSCFPKDVSEIASYARSVGEDTSLFIHIDELNRQRIPKLMAKYNQLIGGFRDKQVAILGLSFKKNTNDTRVAPALTVIPWLLDHGAQVVATDPQAIELAKTQLSDAVKYAKNAYQAIEGSHAVMLLVEWDDYLNLDLSRLATSMNQPKYFFDTRNQYSPQQVNQAGLIYQGVGR